MKQVIVFSAPNCGPCKQLRPVLQSLQEKHKFPMTVHELSDETMPIFAQHAVRMSPTVIALNDDGSRAGIFVGAQSINIVENHLRKWGVIHE